MSWTVLCVRGDHKDCPDTGKDRRVCDCPCHLYQGDSMTKKPHARCDKAIRGCLAALSSQLKKSQRFVDTIDRRHRDLYNALNNDKTTEKQKLAQIARIATKIGDVTYKALSR